MRAVVAPTPARAEKMAAGVELDGKRVGSILWAPWQLPLGTLNGKHRITIVQWNSLAGRMDGYLRENGLLELPKLYI